MSGAEAGDARAAVTAMAEAARATWVAGNRADGQRLQACYELFRACVRDEASGVDDARPGYGVVDPFDVCSNRLVAAFAISGGRADRMIALSVDLTERCPSVLGALVQGRIDQQAAELLVRQLRTVDDSVVDRVQQEALDAYLAAIESGQCLGINAVRDLVDECISRHDADGIRLRCEDAARDRGVHISKGQDGMSTLRAHLATDEMAVLAEALDQHATAHAEATQTTSSGGTASPGGTGDSSRRPLADRRADALMALVCGEPAGSADTAEGSPLRPKVTVIAARSGPDGGEPQVAFPRTGQSSIQALLAMLGVADGAVLERIDPAIGAHDDPDRYQTYRPSAALARAIRLRDGTCRHPGCTVPAEYGDIDHVVPFNHDDPAAGGATREDNHCIFCRRHHRFKTFSGWNYTMTPDGTLTITAPDGTVMRTEPSGPLAVYRRQQQLDEADKWDRQQRRTPTVQPDADPPAEPTYFQRRAARTRTERRIATRVHQEARQRAQRKAATNTDARADTRPETGAGASAPPGDPDLHPPVSVIEARLQDLLDPPPF